MLAAAVVLVAGPVACGPGDAGERAREERAGDAPGAFPLSVSDQAGRRLRIPDRPRRIVSLVPSATGILRDLGAGDRLVARTDFDTVPPLDSLPSVGGGLHPSIERIVALDPDLVVRFAGASDRRTPARLDEVGIRHLAVRPDGIDDVREMIRLLGAATGASGVADSLVTRIDTALAGVRRRVRDRPRKRVAFVLGESPPWVAGPGTFIHELLEVAGAENAFADLGELYGPVSTEAFVARPIELVLAVEGASVELPGARIPVRRVSPGVQRPGADLGESARELARILHPGAFR